MFISELSDSERCKTAQTSETGDITSERSSPQWEPLTNGRPSLTSMLVMHPHSHTITFGGDPPAESQSLTLCQWRWKWGWGVKCGALPRLIQERETTLNTFLQIFNTAAQHSSTAEVLQTASWTSRGRGAGAWYSVRGGGIKLLP